MTPADRRRRVTIIVFLIVIVAAALGAALLYQPELTGSGPTPSPTASAR